MSFALRAARESPAPLRVAQTSVRYARREAGQADPRIELIRRTLYPSNIRNKENPIGSWRPGVSDGDVGSGAAGRKRARALSASPNAAQARSTTSGPVIAAPSKKDTDLSSWPVAPGGNS